LAGAPSSDGAPAVSRIVAVFLALGGTSYAVSKGAIGSREIRDNLLTR